MRIRYKLKRLGSQYFRGNIKAEVALDKIFTVSSTAKALSSLVDEVEQGCRVQLVRAGKPVAMILPINGLDILKADKAPPQESNEPELRINTLYHEIAALEQRCPKGSMDSQARLEIQTKMKELRRLQRKEATNLRSHFQSKTHLDINAARVSIEGARALLNRDG